MQSITLPSSDSLVDFRIYSMAKQLSIKNMIPVPINDFIAGLSIPVDLYVRLSDTKFILICKAGTKTNKEQLSSYKDKTVAYLWVQKHQYHKIINKNLAIAGIVVTNDKLDSRQKTLVVTNAAKSVFNEMEQIGLGFEVYSHSIQVMEATISLVENHKDMADLFASLNDCSDSLLKHSMAVSLLSVLIGQELGWANKQTLEKLSLGGLLHDVGLKSLPPDLIHKPKALMTFDESQLYEQHPYRGMQMLLEIGIVPDDIISIVYEHHENSFGQGFPQKLRNLKIHPLARVVALANEFVNLTVENPRVHEPKNPREALIIIEHTMGQPYNKEAFAALTRIVNKENLVKAS